MKYVLAIFLSLPLFFCTGDKHKKTKNSLQNEGIKGKVKTIVETEEFGQGIYSHKDVFIEKFNVSGNIIESEEYTLNSKGMKDDDVSLKVTYKYDEKGNRVETSSYKKNGDTDKFKYKYNEEGNLIQSYHLSPFSQKDDTILYKYDNDGNLIEDNGNKAYHSLLYLLTNGGDEVEWSAERGIDEFLIVCLYGEEDYDNILDNRYDNILAGVAIRNHSHNIWKYKYSDKGIITEIDRNPMFSSNLRHDSVLSFRFNNNGDTIDCKAVNLKIIISNDEKSSKIITTYIIHENQQYIYKFKKGLVIDGVGFRQKHFKFRYEYDNSGNWISSSVLSEDGKIDKDDGTVKRQIEYY